MSLRPYPHFVVPTETARTVRTAFPKGTRCLRIADRLGTIFRDADFAPLFWPRGQPALTHVRLAHITVLQFIEGLSDRQASDAVRSRIDWKVRPLTAREIAS
jgi:transposase